jgi:hypothetical protein
MIEPRSPTMPDTLAEIRKRDAAFNAFSNQAETDRRVLLAHIDTLTAKVRELAVDLVQDHRGIPYDVIQRLDEIAPPLGEAPMTPEQIA